jgi:carbon starvation protein CstA
MKNEKLGRPIFYGAMITEGFVALIWAAAAIKFADSLDVEGATPYAKLLNAITDPVTGKTNPAILVNNLCNSWLGTTGAIMAILGVVAAPITSGDTALRCARLIAADFLKIKQEKIIKRLLLSLPVFALSITLIFIDFQVLWRYFAWINQSLSVFTFWAITVWLARRGKFFYVSLIPALWMTMVCTTYIMVAPEGFLLEPQIGNIIGGAVSVLLLVMFIRWKRNLKTKA